MLNTNEVLFLLRGRGWRLLEADCRVYGCYFYMQGMADARCVDVKRQSGRALVRAGRGTA